jgi:cephalosporin hydroxylase
VDDRSALRRMLARTLPAALREQIRSSARDVHQGQIRRRGRDPNTDYWRRRLVQHVDEEYFGVGIAKFPEDLWVYERLLWEMRADTVIELGAQDGGSTLWFRDRLRTLRDRGVVERILVISVDVDGSRIAPILPAEDVVFIEGDVTDPGLPAQVRAQLPAGARPFVVEDTGHTYETTRAALEGFSSFVPPGGYLIVEDGVVDIPSLRIDRAWPRGVLPAIRDWLATEPGFVQRRDLEAYGVTGHPGGFLQRTGD